MKVELSAKELSLLQCAIAHIARARSLHAELFWKPSEEPNRSRQFISNSRDIADLLEKISANLAEAIADEHRTG